MKYEQELISMIQETPWLMEALRACRMFHLPDWAIGGGAIRNRVWDVLHGRQDAPLRTDIDLVYCDTSTMDHVPDVRVWEQLSKQYPQYEWNVFNQARTHLKHSYRPEMTSTLMSISYWSETASCVAARLTDDDKMKILAPYGLEDLFELIVRPIPEPNENIELYRRRTASKNWHETWPKLQIVQA